MRARKFEAVDTLTSGEIRHLHEINSSCHWCCCELPPEKKTLDHIKPISYGGPNSIDNLVISCGECNWERYNKVNQIRPRVRSRIIKDKNLMVQKMLELHNSGKPWLTHSEMMQHMPLKDKRIKEMIAVLIKEQFLVESHVPVPDKPGRVQGMYRLNEGWKNRRVSPIDVSYASVSNGNIRRSMQS